MRVISQSLLVLSIVSCARPLAPATTDIDPPTRPAPMCHAGLGDLLAYEPVTLAVRPLSDKLVPGSVAGFEIEITSEHGPAGELMARLGDQLAQATRIDDGRRWFVLAPIPLYETERQLTLWIEGALYDGRLFADVENVRVDRVRKGKNRTRSAQAYSRLRRTAERKAHRGREERRLDAAVHGSADGRLWHGDFEMPMQTTVTSPFGAWRRIGRRWDGPHLGTDIVGNVGWKVRAIGDGRVVMVGNHKTAGRTVVIDHGGGLVSQYLHLSWRHVREGDFVKKGQVIARVGRTGRVTGPHLHLQVKLGGVDVDAESLIALNLSDDEPAGSAALYSALAPSGSDQPDL